jgi:hypothetical protein
VFGFRTILRYQSNEQSWTNFAFLIGIHLRWTSNSSTASTAFVPASGSERGTISAPSSPDNVTRQYTNHKYVRNVTKEHFD